MPSNTITRLAAALAPIAIGATLVFAPAASADTTCTKVASPSGSDSAAGTLDAPFRTAQKLADSLSPGDTGCLRDGVYVEDLTISHGGNSGSPVTVTSYPGERGKVVGRLWVSKTGDYSTISNLDLNGTTAQGTNDEDLPSPTINATHVTFSGNDVTDDHTGICFLVGSDWGHASNTVIDSNRIHDCGVMPAQNHHHGIYVQDSSDLEIVNNAIYDNADRGIQLYPSAQRTHIAGNVIDGNGQGVIFSGDDGTASDDNVVEDNIITNSKIRNNVESYYPPNNPIGHGNVVRNNCIGGGVRDNGDGAIGDGTGYRVESNNVIAKAAKFVNRGGKDFRLESDSPCAGIANGATRSTGTRSNTSSSPVAAPASTNATPRKDAPSISVKTSTARHGILKMKGRVRRGLRIRSAEAAPTKAVIQIRRSGSWYSLKTVRIVNGHFKSSFKLPANLHGVVTLRVLVPAVAKSRPVRVRAQH
jgi:parallel beta-helix repeat protein